MRRLGHSVKGALCPASGAGRPRTVGEGPRRPQVEPCAGVIWGPHPYQPYSRNAFMLQERKAASFWVE
jgi:hypothetical protein